ncbi:MAG: formylglycine-generating enzyme family protein, partial [Candidatus Omnitrophica bacterium]|nr:formylglycine-generating enzyme family protein [Candidatus Omnitrophota bacterium]
DAPVRGTDGKLVVTEATGVVFVLVPPGVDAIGAAEDDPGAHPYERPVTEHQFDAFLISKFELTHAQWLRMYGETPSAHAASGLHPVESVSQKDALEVLGRHRMTLPSEAEWEYACRAGTDTGWSSGPTAASLVGVANLEEGGRWTDGYPDTAPVGSLEPNPWGLHDVHGNVREWLLELTPNAKPYEYDGRNVRVGMTRGGSFRSTAEWCRSAARHWTDERSPHDDVGFRAVRRLEK